MALHHSCSVGVSWGHCVWLTRVVGGPGIVDGVVEELGGSGQTLMVGVELFVVVEVVC